MERAWRTEDVGPERAPGSDARLMEYLILGLASVVSPFMAFAEPLGLALDGINVGDVGCGG